MIDFETWYIENISESDEPLLETKTLKELLEIAFNSGASYQREYTKNNNAISKELDDVDFEKNNPDLFEPLKPFSERHPDISVPDKFKDKK